MKTNAARVLDASGVSYEIRTYKFAEEDLSAVTAAQKLDLPPDQVFKTLVAQTDSGEILLACVPAASDLDLKALGRYSGFKRADLAAISELQKLTGYVRGGVSPIGTKRPHSLFIDESCLQHALISISAGKRGVQILIDPKDLIKVQSATVCPIAR